MDKPSVPEQGAENKHKPAIGEAFNPFKAFKVFVLVPDAVIANPDLSAGAKLAYGRLLRYHGKNGVCNPAVGTVGRELGVSVEQAKRYLAELKADGLLRSTRHGRGKPNSYEFLWHWTFEAITPEPLEIPDGSKVTDQEISDGSKVTVVDGSYMTPKEKQLRESSSSTKRRKAFRTSSPGSTVTPPEPTKKPKPISSVDDDEKTKLSLRGKPQGEHVAPAQYGYATPRDELVALVERVYGEAPRAKTLTSIGFKLEMKLPPATWADFLDAVRADVERGALKNVEGFLMSAAKNLSAATKRAEAEEAPPPPPEKCPLCGCPKGRGVRLSSDGKRLVFCSCASDEFKAEKADRGISEEQAA